MARARSRAGRRADYTWQGTCFSVALASSAQSISESFVVGSTSTLMRSRGSVIGSVDGAVDNDKACVAVGLIVVTEEQLAAGAASVPSPHDDLDAEWIWHGFLLLQAQGTSTDQPGLTSRLEIDSKAMRRMKQTQSIVFAADNTPLAGTPAVDVTFGVRHLVGL